MDDAPWDELLWISPHEALAVVLGTVGMYLGMLLIVRVLGQRMLGALSSYDLVAIIAFGSILGRAALGEIPVLGGGLVALLTLISLQAVAGAAHLLPGGARIVSTPPVVLMADGQVLAGQLRRAHVSPDELRSRLRLAGIRAHDEVAVALLEPTGSISVLHRGAPIEPELLNGVVGAGLVPRHLLAEAPVGADDVERAGLGRRRV